MLWAFHLHLLRSNLILLDVVSSIPQHMATIFLIKTLLLILLVFPLGLFVGPDCPLKHSVEPAEEMGKGEAEQETNVAANLGNQCVKVIEVVFLAANHTRGKVEIGL